MASRLGPAFSDSSVLAPGFGVAREFSQGIIFSERGVRVRQSLTPKRRLATPSVCATCAVARRICRGAPDLLRRVARYPLAQKWIWHWQNDAPLSQAAGIVRLPRHGRL